MKEKFILIIIFISSTFFVGSAQSHNFNDNFNNYKTNLQILENDKILANFQVTIANSDEEKKYGLMNIKKLPQNLGMLFIIQGARMWMKNTFIPLDIIFFDKNNKIIHIEENTIPHSLKIISSKKQSEKVLEINAGLVKKYKIKNGNILR